MDTLGSGGKGERAIAVELGEARWGQLWLLVGR